MERFKQILFWASKVITSLGFLLASSGKLTQKEAVINMFREWGYFDGFYLLIGILELSLAILVLIPKTSVYAAIGLFAIMIGAMITHLIHDPLAEIIRPLVFMILLGIVIYFQRASLTPKTT